MLVRPFVSNHRRQMADLRNGTTGDDDDNEDDDDVNENVDNDQRLKCFSSEKYIRLTKGRCLH